MKELEDVVALAGLKARRGSGLEERRAWNLKTAGFGVLY
jgi:hypothetical protein